MRKKIKKYLIPHKENGHQPHLLTGKGFVLTSLFSLFLLAAFTMYGNFVNYNYLAAVIPSVLVDLTNQNRVENDLQGLTPNATLTAAAQLKANHMAQNEYFAHTSPDGITPWYWFQKAGYEFIYGGENLAVNFTDSSAAQNAWMNSPTHKANILGENFTEIGIATAQGFYKGQPTVYTVQLFGKPKPIQNNQLIDDASSQPEVAGVNEVIELDLEPVEGSTDVELDTDFIAVRNLAIEDTQVDIRGTEGFDVENLTEISSLTDRAATQPSKAARAAYMAIAGVVLIVLVLAIFIDIKTQHKKIIIHGLILLLLLFLLFLYAPNVISQVEII